MLNGSSAKGVNKENIHKILFFPLFSPYKQQQQQCIAVNLCTFTQIEMLHDAIEKAGLQIKMFDDVLEKSGRW